MVDASGGRGRASAGGFDAQAAASTADAAGTSGAYTLAADMAPHAFLFSGEAVLDYVRLAYI